MNRFTPTLTQLSFGTCVFGGILCANRMFKPTLTDDSKDDNSIVNSIGFRTVASVFYAYLALNVNDLLKTSGLVSHDVLYWGYVTALGGFTYEYFEKTLTTYRTNWNSSQNN